MALNANRAAVAAGLIFAYMTTRDEDHNAKSDGMSEEINIFKCLDYIRDNATEYAQAKANRLYLEQYRKSQKALLINDCDEKTAQAKESYAYAHPEYLAVLTNYKTAVEIEERLKWLMTSAQLKIEVWRSQNANNRFIDKVHT